MRKNHLIFILLVGAIWAILCVQSGHATVETGWPAGTPNTCKNDTDGFMNFESGIEGTEIESTIPGLEFTTTAGLNWRYGDIRSGSYNVYPYGGAMYETNGNFFAWLGVTGDTGRITFTGGTASYLSVLVSTYSGVVLDAYDKNDNFLSTSGWATSNLNTRTMSRLTVEAEDIAYVTIHDTGNYWLMDDLCTDAPASCKPVPGRNIGDQQDRIDLVFVPDEDYGLPSDIDSWLPTFLGHVDHQIDNQLGGHDPITGNLDKFNFYYVEKHGTVDNTNCAEQSSLPDGFAEDCPFADAVVVLHQTSFGDCSTVDNSPDIFSAEGNADRSFIHESGHGIFGLADEYDGTPGCTTFYFQPDPKPNIWVTEDACRTDATNEGWNPDDCQMFTTCQSDWWKVGTTAYIMEDGTHFANGWGEPAASRISWVLGQYQSNSQSAAASAESSSKSIRLELNMSDNGVALFDTGFSIAPSPEYFLGAHDFVARVVSTDDLILGEYGFGDPRKKYAEWDYIGPLMLDNADFTLVLPYFYNGSRVDIINSSSGEILISVDISEYVDPRGSANLPPVANAGPDQTLERTSTSGASVTLDGSASSDPDNDPLTYNWTWSGGSASGVNPAIILPVGLTTITLTVSDGELSSTDTVDINVVDTTPPAVNIISPTADIAVQDGVTLKAEASDISGVASVHFYVREPGGADGIPIGQDNLAGTLNVATGKWEYDFDTTKLQDGYYVILAKATDTYGNEGWSGAIPFSIRNWAVIALLPSTPNSKAGRTMPVKFSLRIASSVDPAMPFVTNDELEIRTYRCNNSGCSSKTLMQTSRYGKDSTNYRIENEHYITNFKTQNTPATYLVEIWRPSNNFMVGSFTFKTVK